MSREQEPISSPMMTQTLQATDSKTSSTLRDCDISTVFLNVSSTFGRTTAAITRSLTLPGVDIVLYENVNGQ